MISLKDIPIYLSIAGTMFGSGVYIHDIRRDVAELGVQYRQHVNSQQRQELKQEKWRVEDRLKKYPEDEDAMRRLQEIDGMLQENMQIERQLKGEGK